MPGKGVQYGPNTVLKRPDLAAAIANVCANWSLVENHVISIYAFLMGDYLPRVPGYAPPTHPVARQVMDALNAFNPKLELLCKLLDWREPELSQQFREGNAMRLRKRYNERSEVAHGTWAVCDDYPDALILAPTFGAMMIYKIRDFDAISERILEEVRALGELTSHIYKKREQRG